MTMTYLFVGDSLTEGRPGESYVDRVSRVLGAGTGQSARVVNAGRSCETALSLQTRLDSLLQEHRPDWVILAVGTNDVWLPWLASQSIGWWLWLQSGRLRGRLRPLSDLDRFAAAYRALVDLVRTTTNARLLLCTPPTLGERLGSAPNQRMARLTGVIKHVAVERGVPVADVWQGFVQELAGLPKPAPYLPVEWLFAWLDRRVARLSPDQLSRRRKLHLTFDGIHLNSRGADLWAATVVAALVTAQQSPPDAGTELLAWSVREVATPGD
jgi:lysophospholipase L1-like esterase